MKKCNIERRCTLCYFCGGSTPPYLQHNNASFFRYVKGFVVQFGISRLVVVVVVVAKPFTGGGGAGGGGGGG